MRGKLARYHQHPCADGLLAAVRVPQGVVQHACFGKPKAVGVDAWDRLLLARNSGKPWVSRGFVSFTLGPRRSTHLPTVSTCRREDQWLSRRTVTRDM